MTESDDLAHFREIIALQRQADEELREAHRRELDRRLEELNRLRQQVIEDRDLFLRRETYEVQHSDLEHRIDAVEEQVRTFSARMAGSRATSAFYIAAGGILVALITLVVHVLTT